MSLWEPFRRFIAESQIGEVKLYTKRGRLKLAMLYLCSDLLIIAKQHKGLLNLGKPRYRLKGFINLITSTIRDYSKVDEKNPCVILIESTKPVSSKEPVSNKELTTNYMLWFTNEQIKTFWLSNINGTKQSEQKRRNSFAQIKLEQKA